ncbi:MAG: type IV secretion system DNA-binding domain-containing protein, partial [Bacteroidales bacterium]|nr:type IV secretion system DNA-binding domain-containing protein [Bacteroidales bacterium]
INIFVLFQFNIGTVNLDHCRQLYVAIDNRLPAIFIEPVNVNSIWFKDCGIINDPQKRIYINPKPVNDSTRYSLSGRGEASSIIKMLSILEGQNQFCIKIFAPLKTSSSFDHYSIDWNNGDNNKYSYIQANAMTTLPDLQDLQDAASTFQFNYPLFSPDSDNGKKACFFANIYFETSIANENMSRIVVSALAHEIAGVGRFKLGDDADNKCFLSEIELFHLIRLPFGKIPGFASKSKTELSYDIEKYGINNNGIILGNVVVKNSSKSVPYYWDQSNRNKHMWIIGKTGTGKSYFLSSLISRDILNHGGLMIIDPHGDLIDVILKRIPHNRQNDIILFDPSDTKYSPGLNLFEANYWDLADISNIIEEAVSIFIKLYGAEIFGPRIQHYFRQGLISLMEYHKRNGGSLTTLKEIAKLYINQSFLTKIRYNSGDTAKDFWEMYDKQDAREKAEILPFFQAKFDPLVSNYFLKTITEQQKSMINFEKVIDSKKIVLVNLCKGLISERASNLLGMILISQLNNAIMKRAKNKPNERKLFTLYVDEFQNFASQTFANMLSEARKYGLSLVLANQYINQLKLHDPYQNMYADALKESIFGNSGTIVSFRISESDSKDIATEMDLKIKDENPFVDLNNYECIVSTIYKEKKLPPVKVKSLLWDGQDNFDHSIFIQQFKKENCKSIQPSFRNEVHQILDNKNNFEIYVDETIEDNNSTREIIENANNNIDETIEDANNNIVCEKINEMRSYMVENKTSEQQLFDFSAYIKEMRENKEKCNIISEYETKVGPISDNIAGEEWYKNYVSKFVPLKQGSLNIPEELQDNFNWDLLIQLIASSFSSTYLLDEITDTNKVDCFIQIQSGDQIVAKRIKELWSFQILKLFEIYIEEMINIHILSKHDKTVLEERLKKLQNWEYEVSNLYSRMKESSKPQNP